MHFFPASFHKCFQKFPELLKIASRIDIKKGPTFRTGQKNVHFGHAPVYVDQMSCCPYPPIDGRGVPDHHPPSLKLKRGPALEAGRVARDPQSFRGQFPGKGTQNNFAHFHAQHFSPSWTHERVEKYYTARKGHVQAREQSLGSEGVRSGCCARGTQVRPKTSSERRGRVGGPANREGRSNPSRALPARPGASLQPAGLGRTSALCDDGGRTKLDSAGGWQND